MTDAIKGQASAIRERIVESDARIEATQLELKVVRALPS